jgi:hypothetical protein
LQKQDHVDVLIRELWERGMGCILKISIIDTYADYYMNMEPLKVPEAA